METGLTLLGVLDALLFFGGIAGAVLLPGWLQNRHRELVRRQIDLTDALDGTFGPIVAPIVKRPLWGPWTIELAVSLDRLAVLGRIVAVANEVLSVTMGLNPGRYRIILTPKPHAAHAVTQKLSNGGAGRWAGDPLAAAR
jgi:hypothetical protein